MPAKAREGTVAASLLPGALLPRPFVNKCAPAFLKCPALALGWRSWRAVFSFRGGQEPHFPPGSRRQPGNVASRLAAAAALPDRTEAERSCRSLGWLGQGGRQLWPVFGSEWQPDWTQFRGAAALCSGQVASRWSSCSV